MPPSINRIFDYINRRSPILIHTPWVRNIGDCAEQIYYGLLKARRDGKKIVFLRQHELFWKFRIGVTNRELFDIESDYSALPARGFWRYFGGWFLAIVFGTGRAVYLLYRKFLRMLHPLWPQSRLSPFRVWYTMPTIGFSALWQPDGMESFSWDVVRSFQWEKQHDEFLSVRLADEKRHRAEQIRAAMGIPQSDWFVCLHVREAGFLRDGERAAYRNASIQNYFKGMQLVTDAGGWVVRLGDPSMTPLPSMERVIDYPHTKFWCDLMDIYLVSECRFYLGTNSGPADVARLFQKAMVLTNITEWSKLFPARKGDLVIFKHLFSRSRNRFLSLSEISREPAGECQIFPHPGEDYVFSENTAEEIRDVIEEFLDQPADYEYSELQEAFNHARSVQIRRWIDEGVFWPHDAMEDVIERYHFASRVDSVGGTVGQRYLDQNWVEDRMNVKNVRAQEI